MSNAHRVTFFKSGTMRQNHRVTFSGKVALDRCITTGQKRLHGKLAFVNGAAARKQRKLGIHTWGIHVGIHQNGKRTWIHAEGNQQQ